jgi:hypothetical protein
MSPLGKSGKYYMNPHEMRRKKDMPGASQEEMDGATHPGTNEDGGDGNHHHELHGHEDGTMHSVHTHPDGSKEEMNHASYSDARDHMDSMWGEEGGGSEDEEHGAKPPMSGRSHAMPVDTEDMAGMYEKAGRG